MKKYGAYNDYLESFILYVDPPKKALQIVDKIFDQYELSSKKATQGEIIKYWRIEKRNVPIIEHDSITFSTDYISMFYCNGENWVQLLDAYTDTTD